MKLLGMNNITPFSQPIFITRPLLPDLNTYKTYLESVWKSQWLTNMLGPTHNVLEKKLAKILKVKNLSLFNNGTSALITACQTLKLKGEVIATPFTFAATPHALTWNKITPVFCDIDPKTLTIDPNKIEALITKKTTGILGVHVYGFPCDVKKIQKIADKYKLKVIYDAAHAFMTEIDSVGIGNYGDITMFSFHATKLFHTAEGGALTYKNDDLKNIIYYLKNFGIKNEEEVVMPGINGKMNEIQSALGLAVLEKIDEERKERRNVLKIYSKELSNIIGLQILTLPKNITPSYQYFVIRINQKKFGYSRDYVYEKLKEYNVFARKYFYPICSNFECYQSLPSSNAKKLPIANMVAKEVLALPFYGKLSKSDIIKICKIIKKIQNGKSLC